MCVYVTKDFFCKTTTVKQYLMKVGRKVHKFYTKRTVHLKWTVLSLSKKASVFMLYVSHCLLDHSSGCCTFLFFELLNLVLSFRTPNS